MQDILKGSIVRVSGFSVLFRTVKAVRPAWTVAVVVFAASLSVPKALALGQSADSFAPVFEQIFNNPDPQDGSQFAWFDESQREAWTYKWQQIVPLLVRAELIYSSKTEDWFLYPIERSAVQKFKTQLATLILYPHEWEKNAHILLKTAQRVRIDRYLEKLFSLNPLEKSKMALEFVEKYLCRQVIAGFGQAKMVEMVELLSIANKPEGQYARNDMLHALFTLHSLWRQQKDFLKAVRDVLEKIKISEERLVELNSQVQQTEAARELHVQQEKEAIQQFEEVVAAAQKTLGRESEIRGSLESVKAQLAQAQAEVVSLAAMRGHLNLRLMAHVGFQWLKEQFSQTDAQLQKVLAEMAKCEGQVNYIKAQMQAAYSDENLTLAERSAQADRLSSELSGYLRQLESLEGSAAVLRNQANERKNALEKAGRERELLRREIAVIEGKISQSEHSQLGFQSSISSLQNELIQIAQYKAENPGWQSELMQRIGHAQSEIERLQAFMKDKLVPFAEQMKEIAVVMHLQKQQMEELMREVPIVELVLGHIREKNQNATSLEVLNMALRQTEQKQFALLESRVKIAQNIVVKKTRDAFVKAVNCVSRIFYY